VENPQWLNVLYEAERDQSYDKEIKKTQ